MNFKLRFGEFIGILIPGLVLILNILIFLFPTLISKLNLLDNLITTSIFVIVISFIVGMILRTCATDSPDKISLLLRRSRNKSKFPYLSWICEKYKNSIPSSFDFIDILDKLSKKEKFDQKAFFNECKLIVLNESETLKEEVLYTEGTSRMISGLYYSILYFFIFFFLMFLIQTFGDYIPFNYLKVYLLIDSKLFDNLYLPFQIIANMLIFIRLIYSYRHLRVKEVSVVFTSLFIIMNKNVDQKKVFLINLNEIWKRI